MHHQLGVQCDTLRKALNGRLSVAAASRILGVSWRTAKRGLTNAPRKKPPTRKSVVERRRLVEKMARRIASHGVSRHPVFASAAAIASALGRHGVVASKSTVLRDLRALGFRSLVRRHVPTRDPSQWCKRASFAQDQLRRGKLADVVFSDESSVSCNDDSVRTMWVTRSADLLTRERKRVHNVGRRSFWGAIGVGFKSDLILFKQGTRLDADQYVRLVLQKFVPTLPPNRRFQQDGAKCHTASRTTRYLANKGVKVFDWVAHSPDLSPIETLWALLKKRVAKHHPQTVEELDRALLREWAAVPMSTVNALCLGFKKRLQRCVDRGGEP